MSWCGWFGGPGTGAMACIKGHNVNKVCSSSSCSEESVSHIYHEKQSKEMCALHALNNLYQDSKAFSKKQLDSICYSLSPASMINPHKSMFGFGNYDVNVLMSAVQLKDSEAIWFDKRKDVSCLCLKNIHGFILNIPTEYKWGIFTFPIHRKHWIALRDISGVYYNLDSKLDSPELIGKPAELLSYLKEQLECQDKELLVIVSKEVEMNGTWRVVDPDLPNGVDLSSQRIFKLTINTSVTADGKEEITGVLCDSLPQTEQRKQSNGAFIANQLPQSTELTEPVQPAELTELTEPVQTAELTELTEPVQPAELTKHELTVLNTEDNKNSL
ncbi:josephin-1-like [Tubulanus polymorphus]|uniref:josephin-1-like n=1 Tax=Tubulanus polymorphus TaxID=672921 RepID=UPI003DA49E28